MSDTDTHAIGDVWATGVLDSKRDRLFDRRLLDRADGLVLILLFTIFIYITVGDVRRRLQDPLVASAEILSLPSATTADHVKDWGFLLVGVLGLAVGGQLTVAYGSELAAILGVSVSPT